MSVATRMIVLRLYIVESGGAGPLEKLRRTIAGRTLMTTETARTIGSARAKLGKGIPSTSATRTPCEASCSSGLTTW